MSPHAPQKLPPPPDTSSFPRSHSQISIPPHLLPQPINLVCACRVTSVMSDCDPMDLTRQAPLSMGFSRQEYWSGLPFPSPGNSSQRRNLFPTRDQTRVSCVSCIAGRFFTTEPSRKPLINSTHAQLTHSVQRKGGKSHEQCEGSGDLPAWTWTTRPPPQAVWASSHWLPFCPPFPPSYCPGVFCFRVSIPAPLSQALLSLHPTFK